MNRGQSALAWRVRQGGTGPAPPLLHSYIGWLQNSIVKISRKEIFDIIILIFAKFEENVAKHEIKNFEKISQHYENKIFAATLVLHNLLSATHPPLLSAKKFFIAAWQCFFEMKTNKELYFSILSSLIL